MNNIKQLKNQEYFHFFNLFNKFTNIKLKF